MTTPSPFSLFTAPAPEPRALERLYARAFPDEDLWPLVRALIAEPALCLSIFAAADGRVIAHAAFTICGLNERAERVGLLGPVAVEPERQRQGAGRMMIQEGLSRLRDAGIVQALVLGDPAYYSRFGFKSDARVRPPYPLPAAFVSAWQAVSLRDDEGLLDGDLIVPEPWRRPELWGP